MAQAGKSVLSPEDVLAIREEYRQGLLSPMRWARAKGCSPETIRRAARGETHTRSATREAVPLDDAAASLERLRRAIEGSPGTASSMLDELGGPSDA